MKDFTARFRAPLEMTRPRGCRLLEAFSPKLARPIRVFDHARFEQWIRLEADPAVLSLCERPNQAAQQEDYQAELLQSQATWQQAQALDAASNAVIDLVRAGRLDEAEQAARELLVRYPEVHDGYDRLGMVHEARGQFRQAADCYRSVVEFARANPENYDCEFVDSFLDLIAKLEASAVEAQRAVNNVDRSG